MNSVLKNINDMFDLYKTITIVSSEDITVDKLKSVTLPSNEIINEKSKTYVDEYFTHLANYLNQSKEKDIDNISFDNFIIYIRKLVNIEENNKEIKNLSDNLISIKLMDNEDIKKIDERIESIKNSNLSFDEKTDFINDLKSKKKELEQKELQISDEELQKEQEEKVKQDAELEQKITKAKEDNKNKFDGATTKGEAKKIKRTEKEIKRLAGREQWLRNRTEKYKQFFPKKFGHWFKYLLVAPIITDLYKLAVITYDKYVAIPGKQNKRARLENNLEIIKNQINKRAGIVDENVLVNQIKTEFNEKIQKEKISSKEKKEEKTSSKEEQIEKLKGYKKEMTTNPMTPEQIKVSQTNIGDYKPRGR